MEVSCVEFLPATLPLSPDGIWAERRVSRRQRMLKRGQIVFRDGRCAISCHMLDESEQGAQLAVGDPVCCPKEFSLHVCGSVPRRCRVVRRTPMTVGVRYL